MLASHPHADRRRRRGPNLNTRTMLLIHTNRAAIVAARTATQVTTISSPDRLVFEMPSMTVRSSRPISRNTAFSSRNAIVRQLVFSAMREAAVCSFGDLWPSNSPVTTTASTPDACIASAGMNATQGATKDNVVSRIGSRMCLRIFASTMPASSPTATPPPAARTNRQPISKTVTLRVNAAIATLSATRAVASLTRLSPSRIETIAPRHPDSPGNGAGCDGVGRRDDGTESKCGRQRDGGNPPGDQSDGHRRKRDGADRQQDDGVPVRPEIHERGPDRG